MRYRCSWRLRGSRPCTVSRAPHLKWSARTGAGKLERCESKRRLPSPASRAAKMGYKCDVCEQEDGSFFCFADEAVLCRHCDNSVHGGTKAAQKHERVKLSPGTHTQQCDICQEQKAVMFCSEDRALICRREAGRTDEGTSRRLRRGNAAAAPSNTPAHTSGGPQQAGPSSARDTDKHSMQMPHAPSSGNLIHTEAAVSQGAAALLSPFGAPGAFPFPSSDGSAPGSTDNGNHTDLTNSGIFAPAAPWSDRPSSMTLAAELLGVPSVSMGFTAKDIDAAYMLNGSGDLDAGLSALLEVPDFDARSFAESADLFTGDMMGLLPQQPHASGHKHKDGASDGVVPDLFNPAKRQRM